MLWHHALAWWTLPALAAIIGWLPLCKMLPAAPVAASAQVAPAVFRHHRAWTLGLYFGLINGGYASLIAWLPPYYMQLGHSAQFSGTLLALMTVGQTAGALVLPMLARHEDRRVADAGIGAAVVRVLRFHLVATTVASAVGSELRRRTRRRISALSGAGAGPFSAASRRRSAGGVYAGHRFYYRRVIAMAFGLLRSLSGNYQLDWEFHAICVFILMALTLRFVPARYPHQWRAPTTTAR